MSNIFNYDAQNAARIYDNHRFVMGTNVIAGLLHVHCKKSLKDIHVLDAGCGTGQASQALIDLGIGKVTLLDASAEMLSVARDKLKTAIDSKAIDNIIQAKLPLLPFDDGAFDAIMYNFSMHHLDKAGHDGTFPMMQKALLETRRALRQNGVLLISTIHPTTIKDALWFAQVHHGYRDKLASLVPHVKDYFEKFDKTGFKCVAAMNLLPSDSPTFIRNYLDPEGPLREDWRKGTSMFEFVDNQVLKEMENAFFDMKEKGTLEQFMEDHDRTSIVGMVTMFACVPKNADILLNEMNTERRL